MAENSPAKRNRSHQVSPRKHPYVDMGVVVGKSPLRPTKGPFHPNIQNNQAVVRLEKPLSLVNNENQDFFSFSGGSSLFPNSKSVKAVQDVQHKTERSALRLITSTEVSDNNNKSKKHESQSEQPKFGVIGGNRQSSSSSRGFIPVEKSCIIGGNEIHDSSPSNTITNNVSVLEWSELPSVTSGVLGKLQPRGLNTSFTEKFESRLGLHSGGQSATCGTSTTRGILTEKFIPLFDFPEYSIDILKFWGRMEKRFRLKPDYMDRHKDISHKMRTILIDWIAEVIHENEMTEETLHLTVNFIDRFLTRMDVERTKLQLVGTAALFIASKFEEIRPLETADYVYLTDEAYTKEQIIGMEKMMLLVLEFDLMMPTAHSFAVAYCSILKLGDPIRCLAMYLVDLSLMEGEKYLRYLPSVVAAAAVVLGRFTFDRIYWDSTIQGICTHRKKTVAPCVQDLHNSFFKASVAVNTAVYDKYQAVRYCSISQAFIPGFGPWME